MYDDVYMGKPFRCVAAITDRDILAEIEFLVLYMTILYYTIVLLFVKSEKQLVELW